MLTGQWGDNGLPPAQSSFIIHSMIAQHYMYGGYYPVGGASRMAETIIPVIQQAGGEVFTYASVEKIRVGEQGVTGVRMADGTDIDAPIVISNAGVFNTFEHLLDESVPQRAAYQERLGKVEASMSSICLYIGLQETAEELGLPKTNLWIYPSEHYEAELAAFEADPEADFPLVYVSFPSAKDPSFTTRYPGRATIEIVAPGPHAWFVPWADKPWGKRGEDYEALKERLSQRLLQKLYEKMPQLEGKVDLLRIVDLPVHRSFLPLQARRNLRDRPHAATVRAGLAQAENRYPRPLSHRPGCADLRGGGRHGGRFVDGHPTGRLERPETGAEDVFFLGQARRRAVRARRTQFSNHLLQDCRDARRVLAGDCLNDT